MEQFSEPQVIEESNKNDTPPKQDEENEIELLKEKLQLGMKKIKSSSFLEIRMQSSRNTKLMRKIEKHELVTDY